MFTKVAGGTSCVTGTGAGNGDCQLAGEGPFLASSVGEGPHLTEGEEEGKVPGWPRPVPPCWEAPQALPAQPKASNTDEKP